jgi:hypothetical protein
MVSIIIKINIDNAAFEDDFEGEITEIFQGLIRRLPLDDGGIIRDSNGNKVGTYERE